MKKIYHVLVLVLIFNVVFGVKFDPSDMCIRCLCHGRTGCYFLRNCASYSIKQPYWETAGSPTVTIERQGKEAFDECMLNDECIRETIRGFIRQHANPDCNRDGILDCKDFAMAHYERETCHMPQYNRIYMARLDRCLRENMGDDAPPPGWDPPSQ